MSKTHGVTDAKNLAVEILTISDSRDLSNDEGGAILESRLCDAGHRVLGRHLVTDDPEKIRVAVTRLAGGPQVQAVLATGGTGIASRDQTLEAVAPLLLKELPGFGEIFRMLSFQEIGPKAILSRALAGVMENGVVVFALPGSPKAVALALEQLILPVLPHAVGLCSGYKR